MSCESRGLRPVKMSLPVWAGYAVKPFDERYLIDTKGVYNGP